MNAPGQPLRRLPIDVRPASGEPADIYIRRLAHANHLRPSYLRDYLAGPPKWDAKIEPQRLAALTGRPAAVLQRTLTARGWLQPARPSSDRLRRRHADKPALYAQIRTAAETSELNKHELATRFRVCRRTINKALTAAEPPPWKQPFKKQRPAYAVLADALLDSTPALTARQLWEQVIDHSDIKVSYATVHIYYQQQRTMDNPGQPEQPPPARAANR